jgi:hypothetical protein
VAHFREEGIDRDLIDRVITRWRQSCLIEDGSLLFDDEIWTRENVETLDARLQASNDVTSLRRGRSVAMLFLMVSLVAAVPAGAASTTALDVEALYAPQWVHGTDGRKHVEYDLAVTNAFSADATLESLEVRGPGRRLLRLQGAALAAVTRPLFAEEPTARISAASTNVILMDVVLPRSSRRAAPRRLTHRIRYSIPADARARSIIGSTTVDAPVLRVDRRRPVVIGAPLRGSGWLDSNGCCDDPTANHRFTILAFDGALVNAEVFAIDWTRLVGGALYTGDAG